MVGGTRIELVTPCVSSKCSTAELTAHTDAIKSYQVIKNGEKIKPFLCTGCFRAETVFLSQFARISSI